MTREESNRRAQITGMNRIKNWIENDLVASKECEEMPIPQYIPFNYIKVSFLWSLYYLRQRKTYKEAIIDMI